MLATELAVIMPVLIVLVLLPFHVGLWWYAKDAVDMAAEQCVQAAKLASPDPASAGVDGARSILSQAGNVTNVAIVPSVTTDTATCTVTGEMAYRVVPISVSVTGRATSALERFIAPGDR